MNNIVSIFEKNPNCPSNCNSLLVGKKCIYCMECGRIVLEYKEKKDFTKLMNSFERMFTED